MDHGQPTAASRVMPTHIVAAGGVVVRSDGRILLVKNSYRGVWEYPGGQVEVGENLIEALEREIREESGIEVEVGELFCVSSNTCKYPGHSGVKEIPTKVMFDFICRPIGGTESTSDETSEVGWFTPDEARAMIAAPALSERFQAYLDFQGRPTYLAYVTKPQFALQHKRIL